MTDEQDIAPSATPRRGRPNMPASYGLGEAPAPNPIAWDAVVERLAAARNYWVSTARRNGRPHAMPVWGLWLDGAFCFATDRASRKGRNLAENPGLVVHLESGDDVVILEGAAEEATDPTLLARFVEAYDRKYSIRPDPAAAGAVVYRLRLRTALAWFEHDFLATATRWSFR